MLRNLRTSCLSSTASNTSNRRSRKRTQDYNVLEQRKVLTTFVVTTLSDTVADDGLVSLREAVIAANTNDTFSDVAAGDAEGDRIVFSNSLRGQALSLTEGELEILDDLILRGFGDPERGFVELRIDAGNNSRVFRIATPERVFIRDVNLSNGAADRGGVILVEGTGNVTLANSSVINGTASANGGGIYLEDGSLTAVDSFFASSTAELGGSIFAAAGNVRLFDSQFGGIGDDGNSGESGAGVYAGSETSVVSNSNFLSNIATDGSGGAINSAGEVHVFGGIFAGNSSSVSDGESRQVAFGGAISATGPTLFVSNAVFENNGSERGGAIHTSTDQTVIVDSEFSSNSSSSGGGALLVRRTAFVSKSEFTENSARDVGGAIEVTQPVRDIDSEEPSVFLVVRDSTLQSNTASRGGGLFVRNGKTNVIDSVVQGNFASITSGGIETRAAELFLNSSSVVGNEAGRGGGGISHFGGRSTLVDSSVDGNITIESGGIGGGVRVSGGRFELRDTDLQRNISPFAGGAAWIDSGVLVADGSFFSNNVTDDLGGGIAVVGSGRFVARDSGFEGNSGIRGSAIAVFGSANLSNTILSNNRLRTGINPIGTVFVGNSGLLSSTASVFTENSGNSDLAAIGNSVLLADQTFFSRSGLTAESEFVFVGDEVAFSRITGTTIQ